MYTLVLGIDPLRPQSIADPSKTVGGALLPEPHARRSSMFYSATAPTTWSKCVHCRMPRTEMNKACVWIWRLSYATRSNRVILDFVAMCDDSDLVFALMSSAATLA